VAVERYNDGLPDIMISPEYDINKLYLNKGDFKFRDITDASQCLAGRNKWKTELVMK